MDAMAAISPDTGPRGASFLGAVITVALALVLAWQLAHWTWVFVAPAPRAAPSDGARPLDLPAVARLFGAAAPAENPAVDALGLKLKGVIAPDGGPIASAIFSTGSGRDIAVFVNREITPGVKLVEVDPDHVIITRGGVRNRIDLEAPRMTAKSGAGANDRAQGFHLNVAKSGANNYSLSRRELDQALRDPNQLGYLGQIGMPPGGGVRMDAAPAGSLAAKLGLMPGDVIKKVNGQTVASTGDLARLYTQFATTSAIQAEVQRGSQTVQLTYSIQP
jgi:general secretion pathway protein C